MSRTPRRFAHKLANRVLRDGEKIQDVAADVGVSPDLVRKAIEQTAPHLVLGRIRRRAVRLVVVHRVPAWLVGWYLGVSSAVVDGWVTRAAMKSVGRRDGDGGDKVLKGD